MRASSAFFSIGLVLPFIVIGACGDSTPQENGTGGSSSSTSSASSTSSSSNSSSTTTSSSSSTGTGGTGGSGGGGGSPNVWAAPKCTSVTGTSAVTFTLDEGKTLAQTGPLQGVAYTSLAALDTPNTLYAENKGTLLQSTDAGCTWSVIGNLQGQGSVFAMNAARGGRAYAWTDNANALYRLDNGAVVTLKSPAQNIVGLGVDAKDGLHLRVGDATGVMFDSGDGGATWTTQGTPAPDAQLGYRFAFDPTDLGHALFGRSSFGATVTFDGGATWTTSSGLGKQANTFSLAISPKDPKIVWAESLELGPDFRHVYRSADGGLTFSSVVDDSATVVLFNGNLLVPHPTNPDVLYFVYGTSFAGYGTDIYRYDHKLGTVTKTHNNHDGVSALVASPADPSILYFGLVVEMIN